MKYALLKDDFNGRRGIVAEMPRDRLLEILQKYLGDQAEEPLKEAEEVMYQAFLKT